MSGRAPVAILTSGIGLGAYLPALLLERQMHALGVAADVATRESFFTAEGQQRHLVHMRAYRDDFALALMAQRMVYSAEGNLDQPRIDELLAGWAAEGRRDFVVCSGFWLPMLERYQQKSRASLRVDCLRLDAVVSPSFRAQPALPGGSSEIWLWSWEERSTRFELPVDSAPPLPFGERELRLVVHGGGWGLGSYRMAYQSMADSAWACDVVVHDAAEADRSRARDRFFMVDPAWRTWQRGPHGHTFPPVAELGAAHSATDEHALYALIRRSKAIVSKPGGGTLLDSLSSATPVVLLPPCGDAEAKNGALWEHLGFGIPFAKWRESGASEVVLAELHGNLLRRKPNGPEYPRYLAERILASS
jgi:hypothetical protein